MDKKLLKYIPQNDIYLFNTGNARKAWLAFGCVYIEELNMHRFLVWAPNARSVSVVGSFNNWDGTTYPMEKLESGVWVAFIPGLKDGDLYKFRICRADGSTVDKADPFANFSENRASTASIVWCKNKEKFIWTDGEYLEARKKRDFMHAPMNIYELHAGTWNEAKEGFTGYSYLADELTKYVSDMGYTHVEFLPLTEYPYDGSWGYQVTGYYSPTSRYGDPESFKYLIDRLHSAGIGVIMDWVPAHFPKDEHGLANFDGTPLFECKEKRMAEHPEWGTLIFDYGSDQVKSFLISSACKFFEEFHIDGIRVDAVTSMLYLNYARKDGEWTPNIHGGDINLNAVDFLQKLNTAVLTTYPGVVTIAEESTAYKGITDPIYDGGLGFCFKWDMGFMHDTLDYLEMDPLFRKFHHDKLTFSMMYAFNENYILAFSHDEVVHGKKSMVDKMNGLYGQKFQTLRAFYGYQFAHPGKKLTFMGSEFAQVIEWNEHIPLDWFLLKYPVHDETQKFCRELNGLYKKYPALWKEDKSWDGFKWLNVDDRERSALAFMRIDPETKNYIAFAVNFTPVRYDNFTIALPCTGNLHEILNSDEQRFGGNGVVNGSVIRSEKKEFLGMPCSAGITLPPMSCVFFEFKPRKTGAKK